MLVGNKRKSRRSRPIIKLTNRLLDTLAKQKISKSFLWSSCSWGGTRCPGCGQTCRPHHLTDFSFHWIDEKGNKSFIDAHGSACNFIKCSGEKDWL